MNELHTLIAAVEAQLAELREHAAKDITEVKADITAAEGAVKAELASLLAKLKNL